MNYTSIPQSKHLLELGLKPETADMHYMGDIVGIVPFNVVSNIKTKYPHSIKDIIPCWSVGALLELMPKILSLKPIIDLEDNTIYYSGTDIIKEGKTLMEVTYNMIVWLLKNEYIKTE